MDFFEILPLSGAKYIFYEEGEFPGRGGAGGTHSNFPQYTYVEMNEQNDHSYQVSHREEENSCIRTS